MNVKFSRFLHNLILALKMRIATIKFGPIHSVKYYRLFSRESIPASGKVKLVPKRYGGGIKGISV